MHYRFAGISANLMGPTFALVTSVLGTILVIRKLGVAGIAIWGGVSAIAGHFGLDLDADGNNHIKKRFDGDPAAQASILEETLLEMIPAGIRVGIRRTLAQFESNPQTANSELAAGVAQVVPGGQAVLWLFNALRALMGIAGDDELGYTLRDDDKRALASALRVPYEVVDATISEAENELTK